MGTVQDVDRDTPAPLSASLGLWFFALPLGPSRCVRSLVQGSALPLALLLPESGLRALSHQGWLPGRSQHRSVECAQVTGLDAIREKVVFASWRNPSRQTEGGQPLPEASLPSAPQGHASLVEFVINRDKRPQRLKYLLSGS